MYKIFLPLLSQISKLYFALCTTFCLLRASLNQPFWMRHLVANGITILWQWYSYERWCHRETTDYVLLFVFFSKIIFWFCDVICAFTKKEVCSRLVFFSCWLLLEIGKVFPMPSTQYFRIKLSKSQKISDEMSNIIILH